MRIGKFAVVGLIGLAITEILLFVLTDFFGIFYILSDLMALEVSVVNNFLIHERWTFGDREKKDSRIRRLIKYNLISLTGMVINAIFLFAFTEFLGIYYLISNILAAFIVFNWNYFVNIKKTWKYSKSFKISNLPKNPMVSIVIPTYNENENIRELVQEIFRVLDKGKMRGEIIVVDDNSPDGTWKTVKDMGKKFNVKLIKRKGKLGLSSATVEGFRKAEGHILGVMDADFSHPPEKILDILKPINENLTDISVGSRYVKGGKTKGWPFRRKVISKIAGMLAKPITGMKDPMSGFFFFRREVIKDIALKPEGYKIGLEIFVKGRHSRITEIPFTFSERRHGKSKLNLNEDINYLKHLIKLYWYKVNR